MTLGRRWQHARDFSRPALRCCYPNASFVNDRNVALVTEIRLKSYCFNAISEWSSYICRHRDTVRYHITFSGRLVCQTIHNYNYSSSTARLCTSFYSLSYSLQRVHVVTCTLAEANPDAAPSPPLPPPPATSAVTRSVLLRSCTSAAGVVLPLEVNMDAIVMYVF